jgi:L-amino acid N-acyltransferase YncA
MIIREATPEDAAAIAHVHVASWRATYPGIVPQAVLDSLDEEDFSGRWRARLVGDLDIFIAVAVAEEVVCGFASGGPLRKPVGAYDGEIHAIYLLPGMERKGIGRKLFGYVAAELAARRMHHLLAWTLKENPSKPFYERMKGEIVAEQTVEFGGKSLPSVAYGWMNFGENPWK